MARQFRPMGFGILPPVVKNLLIINILFFLATLAFQSTLNLDLTDYLGLHYWAAEDFQPYQFITYMFMHGGFMHLFFNMFALWMFGNALENVWGPKRFLIYYFITGIGAALVHYLVFYYQISPILQSIDYVVQNPSNESLMAFINSENFKVTSYDIQNSYQEFARRYNALIDSNPSKALQVGINFIHEYKADFLNSAVVVGASGAVFGILLAFGMLFPNALIYVYFAIPVKAKYFVMIYGAIELYSGIANNPGDNVAHFAHLGGMIFGFFLIKYWKRH